MGDPLQSEEGLRLLDSLPTATIEGHQPFWVTRAHLLGMCDEPVQRLAALQRAAGLTQSPSVREHLLAQMAG